MSPDSALRDAFATLVESYAAPIRRLCAVYATDPADRGGSLPRHLSCDLACAPRVQERRLRTHVAVPNRAQRGAHVADAEPAGFTVKGTTVPDGEVDLVGLYVARAIPSDAYALLTDEKPAGLLVRAAGDDRARA